ncbi:MAG: cytochrome c biogenesis protein CcsA, partial [Thermodesulfobacteriota bacterium]|nr:cytochrome c biogenesis protein CcsA [Thermodesulfobacteriota bacterium]
MRLNRLSIAALAAGLALAVSQYFIWVHAPIEQTMGLVQKIFYFHISMAWWSLMSFFMVFAASIGFLFKRTPGFDHAAGAAAEIGVLFSALALTTGTLWARASWGVWWTWDPRLT